MDVINLEWNSCEVILNGSFDETSVLVIVFFSDQTISPDSVAFVEPKAAQTEGIAFINCWCGKHNVLDNLSKVSQVELVVELGGCWEELSVHGDCIKNGCCCCNNLWNIIFADSIKVIEMILQDLLIDSSQDFFFWQHQCNGCEVTLKSEINVERSTLWIHTGSEHDVLQ